MPDLVGLPSTCPSGLALTPQEPGPGSFGPHSLVISWYVSNALPSFILFSFI